LGNLANFEVQVSPNDGTDVYDDFCKVEAAEALGLGHHLIGSRAESQKLEQAFGTGSECLGFASGHIPESNLRARNTGPTLIVCVPAHTARRLLSERDGAQEEHQGTHGDI
jgi:hypothetical protein